jgi:hypothetical protein
LDQNIDPLSFRKPIGKSVVEPNPDPPGSAIIAKAELDPNLKIISDPDPKLL